MLAVQSKEQAQRWLKVGLTATAVKMGEFLVVTLLFSLLQVVHDVGIQFNHSEGPNGSTSPIIQRKLELDKVCSCYFVWIFRWFRKSVLAVW